MSGAFWVFPVRMNALNSAIPRGRYIKFGMGVYYRLQQTILI